MILMLTTHMNMKIRNLNKKKVPLNGGTFFLLLFHYL